MITHNKTGHVVQLTQLYSLLMSLLTVNHIILITNKYMLIMTNTQFNLHCQTCTLIHHHAQVVRNISWKYMH